MNSNSGSNPVASSPPPSDPSSILTRNEVRQVDRWAIDVLGLPGIALMENAGAGAARWLMSRMTAGRERVLILCGPGNNGGDGFVVARHLAICGVKVELQIAVDPARYTSDARTNLLVAQNLGLMLRTDTASERAVRWSDDSEPDWIVDALLGTGAQGELREPIRSWVEAANQSSARRFALDLPTGLDADLGPLQQPIFRAEATATFASLKPGLTVASSHEFVGEVKVIGIGVPIRREDLSEQAKP